MKRFIRPLVIGLAIVSAVAAVVLFLYLRPLEVQVALPREDVPIRVYGLGTVEARIVSQVGFEMPNTLAELYADHGDRVPAGRVMARLHQSEQQAQVHKAMATVSQAEAELKRTNARVEQARTMLAQKRRINQRKQALAERQMVALETAEETQTAVESAEAELAVTRSEVAVAEAALTNARTALELERVILAHHTLKSPYEALVVERHKELGAVLAPGEPVFTLIDPGTIWVLAYVDEGRAGELAVGQPAEIELRSLRGRTFPGRISRIGIESDPVSEERRVYVSFDDTPKNIHLHEQAEALITVARLSRAVLVPLTAIESVDETTGRVWVVHERRLKQLDVRLGHRTLDGRREVVDGLPPDARVVTQPYSGLREGRWAYARTEEVSQ